AGVLETFAASRYSCAESMLGSTLNILELPDDIIHAAGAFGGGLSQGDLCGLLTGGMMAIGLANGRIHENRADFKRAVRRDTQQYWEWWTARAPVHCDDLAKKIGCDGSGQYLRAWRRPAAFLEGIIEKSAE
ncbi:C-GCAxxG-C-C family protein, partial [candidate division KSB1 bacterium]